MSKEVEIWKDIPGYEGLYQVSSLGRVKSLPKEWIAGQGRKIKHNGKIMKLGTSRGGYLVTVFVKNSKRKTVKVHQLVAIAFLNHKPCGMELVVDHINNIVTDNRVCNLQLITSRFNSSKDKKNKTSKYTGVCRFRNKWVANIVINGKNKYLGVFKCELAASYAYQKGLKELL